MCLHSNFVAVLVQISWIRVRVPVMHGTRADKTFKNDIYGFGGNAVSSVAQNNLWSFLSDGSWHSIVPSSPQSHLQTSWPQIVPKIHPETKTWDGDTLISVSSNDDAYPELDGAGSLNIMLFSTSRSVWLQPSASAVSMHTSRCNIISEISFFFLRRFSIGPLPVVGTS